MKQIGVTSQVIAKTKLIAESGPWTPCRKQKKITKPVGDPCPIQRPEHALDRPPRTGGKMVKQGRVDPFGLHFDVDTTQLLQPFRVLLRAMFGAIDLRTQPAVHWTMHRKPFARHNTGIDHATRLEESHHLR